MRLKHLSRSLQYRDPFGAAPTGSIVRFALQIEYEDGEAGVAGTDIRMPGQSTEPLVRLCYGYGLYQFRESFIQMSVAASETRPDQVAGMPDGPARAVMLTTELRLPAEPCLLFYWFEVETGHGRVYYAFDPTNLEGAGLVGPTRPRYLPGETHTPPAWQLTVYAASFNVPDWLPGAVFYQIFPDRFHRDCGFTPERFAVSARDTSERIFHQDWHEDVDIHGQPATGYVAADFFGGSLAGIREKLDYLSSLGVSLLYLNPIFQSRSNHRYDTGDYEKIDPLLGDDASFSQLCLAADERGIRIILDGVFSHTGSDSRYFNKYCRYPETGAWQQVHGQGRSPFGSWYLFHREGGQIAYDSWWGFQDLPNVNEYDLQYRDFIAGTQGVARRWLKAGAAGWRLDVSDELPDNFIRELRTAVKAEKPDAILMGEVWEDASAKISYGSYRDFLLGRSHDLVMGYPFQQALIGWLTGQFAADRCWRMLESIREHYPLPSFYSNFNLIGSHDILRALTALAGRPDPGSREAQSGICLTDGERQRGRALLRLAVLFQMTYPGCPSIYYGDEAGLEGYNDPFNRRTFPWGKEDAGLQRWFAALGRLRRDLPVLRTGGLVFLHASDDCIVFERQLISGRDVFGQTQEGPIHVLAAINRSPDGRTTQLPDRMIALSGYGCRILIDGRELDLPSD